MSFEDWVTNRFGARLYRIFFKTYTEKVWGIPCSSIGAQWAAQRIQGLSLATAIRHMLFGRRGAGHITTLIDEFEYPRLGPGMMWEAFRQRIEARGGQVELGVGVRRVAHENGRVVALEVERRGQIERRAVERVLSTMPLRDLVLAMTPSPPPAIVAAAYRLRYRDFLTVALVVDQAEVFPDNWIYVHDPSVRLGRIQNFKNWSPDMVPDARFTCLGLEYFCFEGDDLWDRPDPELLDLGKRELAAIGLVAAERIVDGMVVRMQKAYPIYDDTYQDAVDRIREYLAGFENLEVAGRNGMHKYNNQDHSMVTAMLAAGNLLGQRHDPWKVNADDRYHEEVDLRIAGDDLAQLNVTQPAVPIPLDPAARPNA